ncbi:glycosyl hydrolase [Paenibacillus sp. LMG 31459]|uniref:Glycosyl hydrolase n=1 Tax=Paenibacillus phytohabitans TaxID=2654978 RepID=A0ABX1YDE3_9BACL|nr:glycoside hydrolase family 88 protein [Paenibacillus phytohabitans]NOU79018.1 glycosyl hydrolase [Paenibacillus phytohabitans]
MFDLEFRSRLEQKVDAMIESIGTRSPHFAGGDGVYDDMPTDWWTSGFWPGILWIMHDLTGREHYKNAAWRWDEILEPWFINLTDDIHHDVGFQFLPTAVIKHTITKDKDAYRRGIEAANFLSGRYNAAGQFIRAWNGDLTGWTIIDCMMNISLLFWASRETGDPRYKHIAVRHADTALKHFIREDGSSRHVVSFDPETGEFIEGIGGQGAGPESAWSRGTGWALYGFANAFKNTGDIRYLQASKSVAHFLLANLPEDRVPYWDFRLPSKEGEPRDTSAAAIAASGLLELAEFVPAVERDLYRDGAIGILTSLTESYSSVFDLTRDPILNGATGHKPAGMYVDGSLIYGDYYYVEAVAKLLGWKNRIF